MNLRDARRLKALKEDKEIFGLTAAEEAELRRLEFLSKQPYLANPCGEIPFGPSVRCVLPIPDEENK